MADFSFLLTEALITLFKVEFGLEEIVEAGLG